VREFDLCPKLSGLQVAKGLCFDYQTGTCHGACMNVETGKKYNKRVQRAIDAFTSMGSSLAIIGRGRTVEENSLVLVERGNFLGYGFFDNQVSISDIESAKMYVRKSVETHTVQNLINSYVTNPRGAEVINFT
jgi:DNA polymerase-3 subunit epsilon